MKKTFLALCLFGATITLSAQELLDFTQPDPVSATPVRSTKLFRFTGNVQVDFSAVLFGGMEVSPSLMMGYEIRPWRNRHYFEIGVAMDYVNSDLGKRNYLLSGDALSFESAENGYLEMDRFGWSLPLTYGFDIGKRKSLEFSVIPHYWTELKLTNGYKGGSAQFDYAKAQGLAQDTSVTIGTYYKGFNPITVDFSVAFYPTANVGFGLKFSPPMLFKKGFGPSYTTISFGGIARF